MFLLGCKKIMGEEGGHVIVDSDSDRVLDPLNIFPNLTSLNVT